MDAPIAFLVGFVVGMGFGAMAVLFPEELDDDDES